MSYSEWSESVDVLLQSVLNFALEYIFRTIPESKEVLKRIGASRVLLCVGNVGRKFERYKEKYRNFTRR
jgi:hypothetical protein